MAEKEIIRMKCTVAYDGTNYKGWQAQNHKQSIQQTIEKALKIMHKREVPITGAGRTDAHVHAYGQVFSFETDIHTTKDKWLMALNGYTPDDIRFVDIEEVDNEFHPRYNALGKIYEYRFNCVDYNVHRFNYCTYVPKQVDIEALRDATSVFIGTHDFTSFNANSLEETPNQVRTIESITVYQDGSEWVMEFRGNGFLRYMVRMISACLLEVGLHRLDKDTLKTWLEAKDKRLCRLNASPNGLYLKKVIYKDAE